MPWGRGAGHHCEQKAFQFIGNKDRVIAFLRIFVLVLPREARSVKMRQKSPADPEAPASSQRPAEDPPSRRTTAEGLPAPAAPLLGKCLRAHCFPFFCSPRFDDWSCLVLRSLVWRGLPRHAQRQGQVLPGAHGQGCSHTKGDKMLLYSGIGAGVNIICFSLLFFRFL